MLVLPYPATHSSSSGKHEWDRLETEAMREVVGWYGKLYHFWQVDRGDELPLGPPMLMGSLTEERQIDVDVAMKERNEEMGIDMAKKRGLRAEIEGLGVHENADWWWKEAEREGRGVYAK
jgi:hypothetical protein